MTDEIIINSDTINNTVDKVENALTILADKLGVASDHFYPIMVKQHWLEGVIWISGSIPLVLFGLFLTSVSTHGLIKDKDSDWWPIMWFSFALYAVSTLTVVSNLPQVINPEYYALKEIMSLVK